MTHDNSAVAYDLPATLGTPLSEICTPALVVDLDAFDRNVQVMKRQVEAYGLRLRAHAKTHKSIDISRYLIEKGGACGMCCQKLSEAEALVNAGVDDVLLTNIVVDPIKIERLVQLAGRARVIVCVDDQRNVMALAAAAKRAGVVLECLLEIEVGHQICGIEVGDEMLALAKLVDDAECLRFSGIQAYQGLAQHTYDYTERARLMEVAVALTRKAVNMLAEVGLSCDIIGGGGTGSYHFEAQSGVYNELQCGSYIFMDSDYFRVEGESGKGIKEFEPSLFLYTSVISVAKPGRAICDAGIKAHSVDSGLPFVHSHAEVSYVKCIDEHGVLLDPKQQLDLNDRVALIPGHCDPTCNLHSHMVGVRDGKVACLWPVTAKGRLF